MIINPFINKPAHIIPPYVKILMPLNSVDGFSDVASSLSISVVGSPTISNTQSKWGKSSLYISTGNYLKINTTSVLNFDAKKVFTLEYWVYITNGLLGVGATVSTRDAVVYDLIVMRQQYTLIGFNGVSGWKTITVTTPLNQWVHVALVGDGTNIKQYIDGVLINSVTHSNWNAGNKFLNLGFDPDGEITGYMNDFRFSDAVVYTTNFTPPTSEF